MLLRFFICIQDEKKSNLHHCSLEILQTIDFMRVDKFEKFK